MEKEFKAFYSGNCMERYGYYSEIFEISKHKIWTSMMACRKKQQEMNETITVLEVLKQTKKYCISDMEKGCHIDSLCRQMNRAIPAFFKFIVSRAFPAKVLIPEFNSEFLNGDDSNQIFGWWWPSDDDDSRLKALDKLIKWYEAAERRNITIYERVTEYLTK